MIFFPISYEHWIALKTPGRVYYLAASSAEDMSRWVSLVCSACGLRQAGAAGEKEASSTPSSSAAAEAAATAASADLDAGFTSMNVNGETRFGSHVASVSTAANQRQQQQQQQQSAAAASPYIHISTCYTGGRPNKQQGQQEKKGRSSAAAAAASCREERRVRNSFNTLDNFLSSPLSAIDQFGRKVDVTAAPPPPPPISSDACDDNRRMGLRCG